MNGGGSQSPSYNTGSGYSGWPQQQNSFSGGGYNNWSSMSPSYNAFSTMASSPLNNQAGVNTALSQPAATPGVAPQQNFTLADANVTAGLPATGMPQPVAPAPAPAPVAPPVAAPVKPTALDQKAWERAESAQGRSYSPKGVGPAYNEYLRGFNYYT